MQSETRRLILAITASMVILLGTQFIIRWFNPPTERPYEPQQTYTPSAPVTGADDGTYAASSPVGGQTTAPSIGNASAPAYAFSVGEDSGSFKLGGAAGDALGLELNPLGAGLATIQFCSRDKKDRYLYRVALDKDEPYQLISPVNDGKRDRYSFATHMIWVEELGASGWALDDLVWAIAERTTTKAVFTTDLRVGETGEALLRLVKSYELRPGKAVVDLALTIENLSAAPLTVRLLQDGPLGIHMEHLQYDMRRLLTVQWAEGVPEMNTGYQRAKLLAAARSNEPIQLLEADKGAFLWTALANKYFGVYTRPVPTSGDFQNYVTAVTGLAVDVGTDDNPGDLLARLATAPVKLEAGRKIDYPFEIYAGPKDAGHLEEASPIYADRTKLAYQMAQSADARCCCTFDSLRDLMVWLLEKIHLVVRNYGIAIMILVVIIRSLLHPLSVWQQKSMFRMQESMSKLQPKMAAIKEQHANDKVKQNQEIMKLYGDEGVNPAASFVSFIPLFIQMPILIALWTALNTDVNLRHAPFDGWWIVDLSAPDAFWTFEHPFTVPILGHLPLLSKVFGNITSINLLPIMMGVSMWLQQKYMPKPHMKAKQEAEKQQAASGKPKSGPTPADQLRQQQMMAYMMSFIFPLMFYLMPAGLNLYWLSTNIFGICESLIIRKQINEERERREREGPQPKQPRKPGLVSRFFKKIAAQAEDLQHKADELAKSEGKSKKKKP